MGDEQQYSRDKRSSTTFTRNQVITFGKYKGSHSIQDLLSNDKQYLIWALKNVDWFKVSKDVEAELYPSGRPLSHHSANKGTVIPATKSSLPYAGFNDMDDDIPF